MHSKMSMTCFVQGTFLPQYSSDRGAFPVFVSCSPQTHVSKQCAWRCVLKQPDISEAINERLLHARFTDVNEYHSLIRYGNFEGLPMELINGRIVYMLSQSGWHSNAKAKLSKILTRQLDASLQLDVRQETPITLQRYSNPSEPIPDISIVKDIKYGKNHPTVSDTFFVAEVARTSLSKNAKEKLDLYASSGIPEYWVIDVSNENARNWNVKIFKDLKGGHYQYNETFTYGTISLSAFPECLVNLEELFDI